MTSFSSSALRCANFLLRRGLPILAITLSASCDRLSQAMNAHTDIVARADGKEFQIADAVGLIVAAQQVPAEPDVVKALANMWIDYTLLAAAVAEDTLLASLDLSPFTDQAREQSLVQQLRVRVVVADTVFDDAEIAQRWTTEGPSAEIRARHILLRTAADATPAQRDSVRLQAEGLRARAVAGENFATLATQNSQDGSASGGGDLGFFGRGQMVQPFEEAAFALEPGQVSSVVETPFGYHVIKVEERRQQALAAADREQFRQQLVGQALQTAEQAYLDSIASLAKMEIQEGGLDVVKEIAAKPDTRLRGRAARREIVTYEGGEYTAEEFANFMRSVDGSVQSQFASAPVDQLEPAVKQLVQMELLLAEAEKMGLKVPPEEETTMLQELQLSIRQLVQQTGFIEAARAGATDAELQEQVARIMEGIIAGSAPFPPSLGPLGTVLREQYSAEINDGTFQEVITQVQAQRAQQQGQQVPTAPQGVPVDSMGMPMAQPPQGMPQGQ